MKTKYSEWAHLEIIDDQNNSFSVKYVYPSGECFYIEPVFYTMLKGFEQRFENQFQYILVEIERIVKNNRKVVFVGDFEHPITDVSSEYVFFDIFDITDKLELFVEDKSRGSDYGD